MTDAYFAPPALRLVSKELIFVAFQTAEEGTEHEKLPLFYTNNKIPVRKAVDVWDMILEPFLDTEHTEDFIEKTYVTLEKLGINRDECDCLRQEVSARMFSYNFSSGLWDWCHLGLYDVLCASLGILSGENHRLSSKDFENFYWRANHIALKGFNNID